MDALRIDQAIIAGLRLGRADGRHRRGALAGALHGARVGERVSDRQPGGRQAAVAAAGRAPVVVPVLLRDRTWPGRLRQVPAGLREAHLADRLAEVELRRRHVRSQRGVLRQSRPRRDRDPQLPLATRTGEGEPKYDDLEKRLAQAPVITVPTITLEGDANGAPHPDPSAYAKKFSGRYEHRTIKGGVGHNLPQEAPEAFAEAVVDVHGVLIGARRRLRTRPTIPAARHQASRPPNR